VIYLKIGNSTIYASIVVGAGFELQPTMMITVKDF
jgi:hypothetical protein